MTRFWPPGRPVRPGLYNRKIMIDDLTLAKDIHEIIRIYGTSQEKESWVAWDELTEDERQGRLSQALALTSKYIVFAPDEFVRMNKEKAELEKRVEKMGKMMTSLLLSMLTGQPPRDICEDEPKPTTKPDEELRPYTRRSDRPFVDMAEQAGVTMRDEED